MRRRGLHLEAGNRLALLLAIPVVVGITMWLVALDAGRRSDLVKHTLLVELSLERLTSELKDAETSQRGYLLTGEPRFLDPYHAAVEEARREIATLGSLTLTQQRAVAQIKPLVERRLAQLENTLQLYRAGGLNPAETAGIDRGRDLMESIRIVADGMLREEQRLLHERETAFSNSSKLFYWMLALGYGVIVLVVASLYRDVVRYRRKTTEVYSELDQRVHDRTALLQAREELLKTFVKHVPAAVAMLDRKMRYLQVSDRWLVDTGIGEREIVGKSHYEVFPELPEHWKEVHRRGGAGESLKAEEDWLALDGKTHTIRWEVHPWGDSGIETGGIIVFFEDITKWKREELELRKFVSLADNSMEFIGICDMNFMPFYANRAALQLVGLDGLEQAARTPVPEFFFPEDQRFIVEDFFPRVVREGRAEVEIRFRHFKTSKPVWMIYNVFFIQDAAGQPVGFATVSRDITARKQAEDILREREATIRTILDTAAQAIIAINFTGTIVLANRMAATMFGYTPDQLLGRQLEILLPEKSRQLHTKHRTAFFSKPKTRPMGIGMELEGLRKDGSEFPIEVSLSSLPTGAGPLAVSFVSDITARKHAETALRDSEQQLRALTGSLLTAQEDERRRVARELHDDITQRLAFLSIELGKLAGEIPESLEETRARVRALQEQTLRASNEARRLSHGLHSSIIEDFGLSIALEEFCEEFARAQGVQVTFEGLVDDSQLDTAGATCLYRVAQESLRNAVVHGHAAEIHVAVNLSAKSIELRVRDNGTGFSTGDGRPKSGLGIVSMRERVRLLGGTLTLSSQPGAGTEIAASVPFKGD